jgi:hypothetical protein
LIPPSSTLLRMGKRARLLMFNCYKHALRFGVNLSLLHDKYPVSTSRTQSGGYKSSFTTAAFCAG